MAETIDSLLVSLGLETDAKSFQQGADAIKGVTDGMMQLAAATGAGLGFKALTSGIANSALEMKRLSDNTGFTIRQIQGLEFAMRRLNLSPESAHDIAKMIPELQRKARFGELNDKAYWGEAFNPTEFSRMGQEEGLKYLISSYSKMNHDQQSFLREGGGFGRDSPITRLMEMGSGFFDETMKMSNKMTYPIDDALLKNAQIFNDEMAKIGRNFEILSYQIGGPLLENLNKMLGDINQFVDKNRGTINGIVDKVTSGSWYDDIMNDAEKRGIEFRNHLRRNDATMRKLLGPEEDANNFTRREIMGKKSPLELYSDVMDDAEDRGIKFRNHLRRNDATMRRLLGPEEEVRRLASQTHLPQGGSLHSALNNPNARSYLDAISRAEGTSGYMNSGYHTMFGGGQFASLADHPRQLKDFQQTDGTWNKTSAAGRYQHTQKSWDEAAAALGLKDFSPQSQDMAALWLIQRAGQLDNVLNGDFMTATNNLGGVWASLPSSPYAQPKRSQAEMESYYLPDYSRQRSESPYSPAYSRSESSQRPQVNQHNNINMSGLGLDAQQVQDSIANALTEAGENLERSFNNGGR
ncbi:glycoside hydrolase family 104 protein [Pectobacterium polaris]|uniref:glycoside hydrolase family 24 protein n=1 Tax=Pectobacterium polaris TaxID=2042057 RepID=UPI001CF45E8A|nr:glycoside hydrolase family 104 protein [Pectobacterium polaris]MCA6941318.1 glycoside hydrolase family 104 protein [Pectobacterium polaris]MCA6958836.1 glycoside hydrolase family 104 protein [Pectobacterium polaris]